MARISTYPLDTSISVSDLLVGTDAEDSNVTKNFSVGNLTDFIEEEILSGPTVLTPFLITETPLLVRWNQLDCYTGKIKLKHGKNKYVSIRSKSQRL